MKKAFVTCLPLIFPLVLLSQIQVTWGVPQKQQRKTVMQEILGEDGSFVYTLRADYSLFGSDEPIIERYRLPDLSLDYSKSIPMKDQKGRELQLMAVWFIDGNIVIFGSDYDKERDIHTLYGETLDDHCVTLSTWKNIATISAEKKSNPGSFYLDLSRDSSHVLLMVNPPYDKYANEKFTVYLLDKNLNLSWQKEVTPPYRDEFFSLDNFIVSKTGEVYMLASISKDRTAMTRTEKRNKPSYYYTVLVLSAKGDSLTEYQVNLDPRFISDVRMTVDDTGNIICAGFYSHTGSNALIGTFYMKIDRVTRSITSKGTMDFAPDFLVQFMSAKKASKGKELYDYDLKHLILRDDGGAVLVAEQFYEVLVQNYDAQTKMYTYTYYYYYNDIIVISINPAGSISWARKIPKYQVSRNDGGYYSSFSFAVSGNKMFFMFNDNAKNLTITDSKKYRFMNNPRKSVAVLVTMDSNGNQQRTTMFSNKDLHIILRPKLFMQISEERMILYGEKGNTFKLADVRIGS